jgi:hypothetical protein
MNAPWPPLRRPRGIHRRTAGLLACGVSPAPPSRTCESPVAREASARRSQSRGRPRIGEEAYRVPFSPSVEIEGPCSGYVPASRGVVKWSQSAFASPRSCQTEQPMLNVYVGEDPSIEKRPARTSAGSSSNGLGREPRGPNQVLSSHNAVILAPATMEFRVGTPFSASAERLSAPNSVSANRRSISC